MLVLGPFYAPHVLQWHLGIDTRLGEGDGNGNRDNDKDGDNICIIDFDN